MVNAANVAEPAPVGTVSQAWEMVVERGKLNEFATAMQSDHPAYRGPDAVITPTFLISAARWAPAGSRVAVGFNRKRLLHGEQEYTFHGALPRAGDVLTVCERVADRFEKPGKRGGAMRFAVVLTEFRRSDGTLVAEAKATYIEREAGA
ncbi:MULTISPECIES: MaoC family dehydratase N-terminal domain-containing protein [unclassified Mycobacterium]|uniref:FAS1-like dehydratase domain-containing protein n=1 Tax=unclassified Mycobacterium TaxID=2642494 RepID=UPI0009ED52F6|nr:MULTISPECIES: MaoC family dehydratase N-terminal domain-containing protein [unclassified Mycobacterium]